MNITKEQLSTWKENRKAWVKALRSGEYEQASGALFNGKGHCCLGVLCRVAGLKPSLTPGSGNMWLFCNVMGVAPKEAREFVGLYDCTGDHSGGDLAAKNDTGSTFEEIAQLIESEPPGLFRESVEDVE